MEQKKVLAQLVVLKRRLREMKMRSKDILNEYYDAENDDYSNRQADDVRKSRLTLKHINRLRKQREVHNVEHATRVERVKKIYARPPAQ
jgi:hypothetical protein